MFLIDAEPEPLESMHVQNAEHAAKSSTKHSLQITVLIGSPQKRKQQIEPSRLPDSPGNRIQST